jgi:hypothetical protein
MEGYGAGEPVGVDVKGHETCCINLSCTRARGIRTRPTDLTFIGWQLLGL